MFGLREMIYHEVFVEEKDEFLAVENWTQITYSQTFYGLCYILMDT